MEKEHKKRAEKYHKKQVEVKQEKEDNDEENKHAKECQARGNCCPQNSSL